jgi:hypothetical protein
VRSTVGAEWRLFFEGVVDSTERSQRLFPFKGVVDSTLRSQGLFLFEGVVDSTLRSQGLFLFEEVDGIKAGGDTGVSNDPGR